MRGGHKASHVGSAEVFKQTSKSGSRTRVHAVYQSRSCSTEVRSLNHTTVGLIKESIAEPKLLKKKTSYCSGKRPEGDFSTLVSSVQRRALAEERPFCPEARSGTTETPQSGDKSTSHPPPSFHQVYWGIVGTLGQSGCLKTVRDLWDGEAIARSLVIWAFGQVI